MHESFSKQSLDGLAELDLMLSKMSEKTTEHTPLYGNESVHQTHAITSIAISLKRIADSLEKLENLSGLAKYLET